VLHVERDTYQSFHWCATCGKRHISPA
jgi:hypothetical protein